MDEMAKHGNGTYDHDKQQPANSERDGTSPRPQYKRGRKGYSSSRATSALPGHFVLAIASPVRYMNKPRKYATGLRPKSKPELLPVYDTANVRLGYHVHIG
jgi:hypothetical protein